MAVPEFTVTAEEVFARFKLADPSEERLAVMTGIINGIVAVVEETTIPWPADDSLWPGRLAAMENAVELCAHRIWSREGAPLGAIGFGRDQSVVRVSSTDPDVRYFLAPWSLDDVPA